MVDSRFSRVAGQKHWRDIFLPRELLPSDSVKLVQGEGRNSSWGDSVKIKVEDSLSNGPGEHRDCPCTSLEHVD